MVYGSISCDSWAGGCHVRPVPHACRFDALRIDATRHRRRTFAAQEWHRTTAAQKQQQLTTVMMAALRITRTQEPRELSRHRKHPDENASCLKHFSRTTYPRYSRLLALQLCTRLCLLEGSCEDGRPASAQPGLKSSLGYDELGGSQTVADRSMYIQVLRYSRPNYSYTSPLLSGNAHQRSLPCPSGRD